MAISGKTENTAPMVDIVNDYYNTLQRLDVSKMTPKQKKEGAIEFVKYAVLLGTLKTRNINVTDYYLALLSKNLRSSIYYITGKHQQSGKRFNTIFLATSGSILTFLLILLLFTHMYERQRRLAIITKQKSQLQADIEMMRTKKYYPSKISKL